jgi:ribosomal protein S18 acetylase RimI-like enzyme
MTEKLKRRAAELLKLISIDVPDGLTPYIATMRDLDDVQSFSEEVFPNNALDRTYLRRCLGPGHAVIFGLRQADGKGGSRIVGNCVLEVNLIQKRIYLTEIGVCQSCRGRNLALWMMDKMQTIATAYGYKHLTSHVTLGNAPSLALHKKFGMKPQRVCAEYFYDGQDAYYMHKQVAA